MGIENEMFLRLLTRAPRTSIASWVIAGSPRAAQSKNPRASQTTHLNANDGQNEVTDLIDGGRTLIKNARRASCEFILIHTSLQRGVRGSSLLKQPFQRYLLT